MRVQAPEGLSFTYIASGDHSSFAIGSDAHVYAWGFNALGGLGDGTTTSRTSPVRVEVPAGVTFVEISASYEHSIALSSDGRAYAWGRNYFGQLGAGDGIASGTGSGVVVPVPVMMPEGVTFTQIAAGLYHSIAIGSDGNAYAWGNGDYGALGDGSGKDRATPTRVWAPDGVKFVRADAGSGHTIALDSEGHAYAWGRNSRGQLGDGTTEHRLTAERVQLPAGVSLVRMAAGGTSSYGQGADGTVFAWGGNTRGQLGDGTTVDRTVPIRVLGPAGVELGSVAAGTNHAFVIGSDGETYGWGSGADGMLGNGQSGMSLIPSAVVPQDPVLAAVRFGGNESATVTQTRRQWQATSPPGCGPADVEIDFELYGTRHTIVESHGFTWGTPASAETSPDDVQVERGAAASLAASGVGDPRPTVQWQRLDLLTESWVDVVGATGQVFSPPTDHVKTAHYRALFANCYGTAVSDEARVVVVREAVSVPTPGATANDSPTEGLAGALANTGADSPWIIATVSAAAVVLAGLLLLRRSSHR